LNEDKTKLTLGIDKEVIKRAKSSGVNISQLTEHLLKVITIDPLVNTTIDEIIKSYEILFNEIRKILKKYNITVEIGMKNNDINDPNDIDHIYLTPYGISIDNYYHGYETDNISVSDVLNNLYSANKILENILLRIIRFNQDNTSRLQDFKFTLKLLQTLSNTESLPNEKVEEKCQKEKES